MLPGTPFQRLHGLIFWKRIQCIFYNRPYEADVPSLIDGSERLVAEMAFPPRGFTRRQFADHESNVKAVVEAYLKVGRQDAARSLQSSMEEIANGFEVCDLENAQISKECPRSAENLTAVVQSAGAVVRKDPTGRLRILFNLGDAILQPNTGYVTVISGPAHRSRQICDIWSASKDLRQKWDEQAVSAGLRIR